MPLAITAALVGADVQPRPVQVNVTGLTIGQTYTVTASSDSWSRTVQGGQGTATATQLLLIDVATPLNAPVIYAVTHAGATLSTVTPVTVAHPCRALLQSFDGLTVAGLVLRDNSDPREQDVRSTFYRASGRQRAIMHYDISGDDSGALLVRTDPAQTRALRELIRQGAPVLFRTATGIRDLEPVEVLGIASAPRVLVGAVDYQREWNIRYTLVDDDDSTPLVMVTLADINAYYSGQMLSAVNTQWTGQKLSDFNSFDWLGAL